MSVALSDHIRGRIGSSEGNAITEDHHIIPQAWLWAPGHGEGQERTLYAKRTVRGQFKDQGRSLKADRHMEARTKSGDEDRGDRAA